MRWIKHVLLAAVLWLCVVAPASAQQNFSLANWYFVATDQNPATQVFSTASGTFVANNNSTYLAWLLLGTDNAVPITGAANNGSGAVRLAVNSTANWQTSEYWNVAGTGVYDQNWQITVIDGTHIDLIGSTYSAGVTGGSVSGPSVGTKAAISATIDTYNQGLPRPGYIINGSSSLTVPNAWFVDNSISPTVALPQADIPGSMPLGRSFIFFNDTPAIVTVTDYGSNVLFTIQSNQYALIELISNNITNTTGTWLWQFLPPVIINGISCGSTCTVTPPPYYLSSNWYAPEGSFNMLTGSATTASTIYCEYGYVNAKVTIKGLGAYLVTGVATDTTQFAIYSQSGGTLTLVDSTGSIASGTVQTASAISGTLGNTTDVLQPNVLYAFCENGNGAMAFNSLSIAGTSQARLVGSATEGNVVSSTANITGRSISQTYNTWPATIAESGMADVTASIVPNVVFRVN